MFFVRTDNFNWAMDINLECAMIKARLFEDSRQAVLAEAIQIKLDGDKAPIDWISRRCLKDLNNELENGRKQIQTAMIWEFDMDDWEVAEVNEYTGYPHFKWIGEGEEPKEKRIGYPAIRDNHIVVKVDSTGQLEVAD